jgi:hypothetical protein
MKMTAINLKDFCAAPETEERAFLHHPFTAGEWSYASNGQLLVRIPRDETGFTDFSWNEFPKDKWRPVLELLDSLSAQKSKLQLIPYYGGHPEDCYECGEVSVYLFGKPFAYRYIDKIQDFPNVRGRLAPAPSSSSAPGMLFFCFDGGQGALMPRACPAPRHFTPIPVSTTCASPAPEHRCTVCGQSAPFGYGVSLRHGREGEWYCAAHRGQAR